VVLKRLGIAIEKVKMMCPAHYCMPWFNWIAHSHIFPTRWFM
jgi:hypothetical protein